MTSVTPFPQIYAESFGANLYHYQDYRNQETDAVIELPKGDGCAFEIKLGANQIDAAAENLLTIKKQIEEDPNTHHHLSCGIFLLFQG